MPEVSVIIPVYNRPGLLYEAAFSVFAQSFTDFELIIVDDGSTDDTPAAAAELAVMDAAAGRCRLISIPHCGFPGAVRNRGVEAAGGRFIAFLDSDDLWQPQKLAAQLSLMRGTGAVISHTREHWLRGDSTVSQRKQRHRRQGMIFNDALKKCIIGPSTVMIERGYYMKTGGFHERLEIAEDYEYWLRITAAQDVEYLDQELTVKRAGGWEQLSEKYGKIEWFRLCALGSLLDIRVPGFEEPPQYMKGFKWGGFDSNHRPAAMEEFLFKCGVWSAGCRKRGRTAEAEKIDELIRKLS